MKLKDALKFIAHPQRWREQIELRRIRCMPRYKAGQTDLFGAAFDFVDSASFCFIYDELFRQNAYAFASEARAPYVIDAGANVGLSVVYFKRLYPESRILALEADPVICEVLKRNVEALSLSDVSVRNEALWDRRGTVPFASEQADGGRVDEDTGTKQVAAIPLTDLLTRPVDLLKLDIEGAEYKVIRAAQGSLGMVRKLFIEYHSYVNRPQELSGLLEVLKSAGFRYYITAPSVFSPQPLVQPQAYNQCDMVLNIYGVLE